MRGDRGGWRRLLVFLDQHQCSGRFLRRTSINRFSLTQLSLPPLPSSVSAAVPCTVLFRQEHETESVECS
jgi:hypothetical protein